MVIRAREEILGLERMRLQITDITATTDAPPTGLHMSLFTTMT